MNQVYLMADIHGDWRPVRDFLNRIDNKYDNADAIIILGDAGLNFFFNHRDENTKTKLNKGLSQKRSDSLKGEKNPAYKNIDKNELYQMIQKNLTTDYICTYFNISKPTLYKRVKEYFNMNLKETRKNVNK